MTARIAVVGGGISGLAAAVRLGDRAPGGTTVTVYEGSPVLGGKLRTGELAGYPIELGAENFLVRDPEGGESAAVGLALRLGLGDDLVHPEKVGAAIAYGGRLVPVPGGTLVGVPGDLDAVSALAVPTADRDVDEGRPLLAPGADVAVGALVRRRLGDEVVDRLVDPMLGGVYAGRADRLSLVATMPALARAALAAHTLTGAVRAAQAAFPRTPGGAVFATVRGGVSRLVEAAAAASGAQIRRRATVRELIPMPGGGWRLTVGSAHAPEVVEADAVVLAVPARAAARLLESVAPDVAATVAVLDYASLALVTLTLPAPPLPNLSGFLVPATEGTAIKAATFLTTKWDHLRRPDATAVVRASLGRYGDEAVLQRDDADLAATVHRELSTLVGRPLPAPSASLVQRWGGALPQYAPGHADRVARVRERLQAGHPTLAVAGAGYDGVGIPVCVKSGEAAADDVLKALAGWGA